MNHQELNQLGDAPLPNESEAQRLFRLERAKRLLALALARQHGPQRPAGITPEQLALLPPLMAVQRLGLPSRVFLAEMRRLAPPPLLPDRRALPRS